MQHNNCLFVTLLSALTDEDIRELHNVEPDAVVLTSMENSDTETASSDNNEEEHPGLPEPLTALFNASYRGLLPQELHDRSKETFHRLKTKLQHHHCKRLESVTRQQSKSREWHIHRAGRITTTTDNISKTYLMDLMHCTAETLNVPPVVWGQDMEETARQAYKGFMAKSHANFCVMSCGLVVLPSEPHHGSSPDGIISYACCGKGVVEIKCPYKYCHNLNGCTQDKQFCLDESDILKQTLPYYYQTQLHMFVCDVLYCDIVVWSEKEFIVKRILRNQEFLQETLLKAQDFFFYLKCVA